MPDELRFFCIKCGYVAYKNSETFTTHSAANDAGQMQRTTSLLLNFPYIALGHKDLVCLNCGNNRGGKEIAAEWE